MAIYNAMLDEVIPRIETPVLLGNAESPLAQSIVTRLHNILDNRPYRIVSGHTGGVRPAVTETVWLESITVVDEGIEIKDSTGAIFVAFSFYNRIAYYVDGKTILISFRDEKRTRRWRMYIVTDR